MLDEIKLSLRKINYGDVELLCRWVADADFQNYIFHVPTDNLQQTREYFYSAISQNLKQPAGDFILIAETDKPIGLVLFHKLDLRNRNAYMSMILCEEETRGKIYGLSLLFDAIDFSFNFLGLHKILGCIYEDNITMIKLLDYCGAKKEGLYKSYSIDNDKKRNAIIYSFFQESYGDLVNNFKDQNLIKNPLFASKYSPL